MRAWTRVTVEQAICGGPCARTIRKGEPVLEIRVPEIKTPFKRCVACAGEPVPADLPAANARAPVASFAPMAHIRTGVNALPFDYKAAQAGREPGEDD